MRSRLADGVMPWARRTMSRARSAGAVVSVSMVSEGSAVPPEDLRPGDRSPATRRHSTSTGGRPDRPHRGIPLATPATDRCPVDLPDVLTPTARPVSLPARLPGRRPSVAALLTILGAAATIAAFVGARVVEQPPLELPQRFYLLVSAIAGTAVAAVSGARAPERHRR